MASSSSIRSMLENVAPGDIGTDDLSLDEEYEGAGGWAATPGQHKGGREARSPLTPTLSLPDSFDGGEYNARGNQQQIPFNRDVELKKMRAEVARVKELMQDRQGMFRDLKISDMLYQQLRLRPENDLTTHELACLRCHEATLAPKRELESTRRTLQDTQAALQEAQKKASDAEGTLTRLTRQQQLSDETHRMEMASLEERNVRLTQRLKEEMQSRQGNDEKAASYDRVQFELTRAQKELTTLQAAAASQAQQLTVLAQSEKDAKAAERDSERSRELLVLDKSFLAQQLSNAEAQRDQYARQAEAAEAKALALDLKVSQLGDQLLSSQLQGRAGFDDRLEKELARLREDGQRELDQLRQSHKELMERENVVLKDAKTVAEAQAEALRKQLTLNSGELSSLQQQLSALQAQRAAEVSEVRAELKLKSFELTTLGATLEDRMGALRRMELELETVRGELAAHKAAFARLENDSELASASIRTQLQLAQSRLSAYEALEEEIDGAVLRVAQAGSVAAASGQPAASDSTTADFLLSMKSVPSHPERRAKQAVLLAQRLLDMEKQRDALRIELSEKAAAIAALTRQTEIAKEALARTSQPTVYLVTKLRDEELAHADALQKMQSMRADREALLASRDRAIEDCNALRARLAAMINQRGEIESLREMLDTLAEADGEGEGYGGGEAEGTETEEYAGAGVGVRTAGALFNAGALDGVASANPAASLEQLPVASPRFTGLGAGGGLTVNTGAAPAAPAPAPASATSSPRTSAASLERAGPSPSPSPTQRRASSPSVLGGGGGGGGAGAGVSGLSPGALQRMMVSPSARASPQPSPKGWHKREEL